MLSPIKANLQMLGSVFNNADVAPDLLSERCALFDCDVDGEIDVDIDGNNTYYLYEGYVYQSGHGRDKCSTNLCLNANEDVPNNCGHHQQFFFPVHYKPCGPDCKGGFCPCLRTYPDY